MTMFTPSEEQMRSPLFLTTHAIFLLDAARTSEDLRIPTFTVTQLLELAELVGSTIADDLIELNDEHGQDKSALVVDTTAGLIGAVVTTKDGLAFQPTVHSAAFLDKMRGLRMLLTDIPDLE